MPTLNWIGREAVINHTPTLPHPHARLQPAKPDLTKQNLCAKITNPARTQACLSWYIAHYQRVVVALKETMRLMGEIDGVIEDHGGWPIE